MWRRLFGVRLFSACLAVVDLLLIQAWVLGDVSTATVFAGHVAATLAVGGLSASVGGFSGDEIGGAALLCLLVGPIGGLMLVIVDLGRGTRPMRLEPATAATRPLSRADQLHAQIRQGRRRRGDGRLPTSFDRVFSDGTLSRQQAAIAALSTGYRPEMLPALQRALASETPAIRVQAAAVYAKLRGRFGERAKAVLAASEAGGMTRALLAEAREVAASGFVDADTATHLTRLAATRLPRGGPEPVPAPPSDRVGDTPSATPERPPRLKRHACGGVA